MKINVKYLLFVLGVILLLTFIMGRIISHNASKKNNFIGVVGGHVYVDNSSDKTISSEEATTCWYMLNSGAPGPVLAFGRLITQRMEITNIDGLGDYCGRCDIRLYTLFNIKYLDDNIHRGCA